MKQSRAASALVTLGCCYALPAPLCLQPSSRSPTPSSRPTASCYQAALANTASAERRSLRSSPPGPGNVTATPGAVRLRVPLPRDHRNQKFTLDFEHGSSALWVFGRAPVPPAATPSTSLDRPPTDPRALPGRSGYGDGSPPPEPSTRIPSPSAAHQVTGRPSRAATGSSSSRRALRMSPRPCLLLHQHRQADSAEDLLRQRRRLRASRPSRLPI